MLFWNTLLPKHLHAIIHPHVLTLLQGLSMSMKPIKKHKFFLRTHRKPKSLEIQQNEKTFKKFKNIRGGVVNRIIITRVTYR